MEEEEVEEDEEEEEEQQQQEKDDGCVEKNGLSSTLRKLETTYTKVRFGMMEDWSCYCQLSR